MTIDSGARPPQTQGQDTPLAAQKAGKRDDLQAQPDVVLTLLEPDQVVAAKQHTRFGPRRLTRVHKFALWGLRIYVVVMLLIVLLSVYRTVHLAH